MNTKAAIDKINEICRNSTSHGYLHADDLIKILNALDTPCEAEKECKHVYIGNMDTPKTYCCKCGKIYEKNTVIAGKTDKKDKSLAERFQSMGVWNIQVSELVKIAESHYTPILEKAHKEGFEAGQMHTWNEVHKTIQDGLERFK